jgi:hypothetical protein
MSDRSLVRGSPISKQPPPIIKKVQFEVKYYSPLLGGTSQLETKAREQFPILSKYEDDWPTRDMISTFLSNASYPKVSP